MRFIRLFIHYIDGGMMTGTEGMLDLAVGGAKVLCKVRKGSLDPPSVAVRLDIMQARCVDLVRHEIGDRDWPPLDRR